MFPVDLVTFTEEIVIMIIIIIIMIIIISLRPENSGLMSSWG